MKNVENIEDSVIEKLKKRLNETINQCYKDLSKEPKLSIFGKIKKECRWQRYNLREEISAYKRVLGIIEYLGKEDIDYGYVENACSEEEIKKTELAEFTEVFKEYEDKILVRLDDILTVLS